MTARRKKALVPIPFVPREPEVDTEPHITAPQGYPEHVFGPQTHALNVRQVAESVKEGDFTLPKFQRPYVWGDEQILFMLDSIAHGYPLGSALVWERYDLVPEVVYFGTVEVNVGSHAAIVIDGQQRLGGIAQAMLTDRFGFDFEKGSFVAGQPETSTCLLLKTIGDIHAWLDWTNTNSAKRGVWLKELLFKPAILLTKLDYHYTMPMILESFKRLNTTGIRMSEEELATALARFEL